MTCEDWVPILQAIGIMALLVAVDVVWYAITKDKPNHHGVGTVALLLVLRERYKRKHKGDKA